MIIFASEMCWIWSKQNGNTQAKYKHLNIVLNLYLIRFHHWSFSFLLPRYIGSKYFLITNNWYSHQVIPSVKAYLATYFDLHSFMQPLWPQVAIKT